jgi:UDP-N-acetylmuramyl pentapeptide synthase
LEIKFVIQVLSLLSNIFFIATLPQQFLEALSSSRKVNEQKTEVLKNVKMSGKQSRRRHAYALYPKTLQSCHLLHFSFTKREKGHTKLKHAVLS